MREDFFEVSNVIDLCREHIARVPVLAVPIDDEAKGSLIMDHKGLIDELRGLRRGIHALCLDEEGGTFRIRPAVFKHA